MIETGSEKERDRLVLWLDRDKLQEQQQTLGGEASPMLGWEESGLDLTQVTLFESDNGLM